MRLGFLGTGAITSAIVTGLDSAGGARHSIRLSPRNAEIAADLAARFRGVSVASSNQNVLDESEVVLIAVRPQVAGNVLSELRFRADHHVISLVSGFSLSRVSDLVSPAGGVARAVPLPSAAKRRSPTAIYPRDNRTAELFDSLGAAFAVDSETEFAAFCTTTATIAAYFAFADGAASWLTRHGIPPEKARDYIARIYSGLADIAIEQPQRDFQSLAADHATAGGTNEQVLNDLVRHGVFESFSQALDGVMRRVTADSRTPD